MLANTVLHAPPRQMETEIALKARSPLQARARLINALLVQQVILPRQLAFPSAFAVPRMHILMPLATVATLVVVVTDAVVLPILTKIVSLAIAAAATRVWLVGVRRSLQIIFAGHQIKHSQRVCMHASSSYLGIRIISVSIIKALCGNSNHKRRDRNVVITVDQQTGTLTNAFHWNGMFANGWYNCNWGFNFAS
jgi:hypothetical protein